MFRSVVKKLSLAPNHPRRPWSAHQPTYSVTDVPNGAGVPRFRHDVRQCLHRANAHSHLECARDGVRRFE